MKSISPKDWDDPVRGHHQCTAADLVVLGFRVQGLVVLLGFRQIRGLAGAC